MFLLLLLLLLLLLMMIMTMTMAIFFCYTSSVKGARCSIADWGTMPQAGRSRIRFLMSLDFLLELILPAVLWSEDESASNRNEYQESSWGVKGDRGLWLATSPPSISRLSRKTVGASTSHRPVFHSLLQG
jgi:hypothetical protein